MAQDAVDDPRICDKRDDLHAGAAGADQGVHLRRCPAGNPLEDCMAWNQGLLSCFTVPDQAQRNHANILEI
jgi:hypothetical protein